MLTGILKSRLTWTFVIGAVVGIGIVLGAEEMDRYTTTNEFCTSCHAMKEFMFKDKTYQESAHHSNRFGVQPRCADCHIPKGLIPATYDHIVQGSRDLYAEIRYGYKDKAQWDKRRVQLAYNVRDWMRANDSSTCRSCHVQDAIKPKRRSGQKEHAEAKKTGMTCIDCHYNLVHEPVEPRDSFLNSAGTKKAK